MFEAHVFSYDDRHHYAQEWDEWLRLRYDAYVLERGWRSANDQKRETDQYDDSDSVYILGLIDGKVATSARLRQSSSPTMVADHFPHLCEREPVPTSPYWIEWTRTMVVPEHRKRGTFETLALAVMEYCVAEGAHYVGGLYEVYHLPRGQWLKWNLRALGLPQQVDKSEDTLVGYYEVNEAAINTARDYLGIEESLLRNRGPWPHLIKEFAVAQ